MLTKFRRTEIGAAKIEGSTDTRGSTQYLRHNLAAQNDNIIKKEKIEKFSFTIIIIVVNGRLCFHFHCRTGATQTMQPQYACLQVVCGLTKKKPYGVERNNLYKRLCQGYCGEELRYTRSRVTRVRSKNFFIFFFRETRLEQFLMSGSGRHCTAFISDYVYLYWLPLSLALLLSWESVKRCFPSAHIYLPGLESIIEVISTPPPQFEIFFCYMQFIYTILFDQFTPFFLSLLQTCNLALEGSFVLGKKMRLRKRRRKIVNKQ